MNPGYAKIILPNLRLRLPVERLTYREIIRTLAHLNLGKCPTGVNNRGIGLAELLIATLVGVVMLLGIGSFFISSIRFYEQSSSQTFLQRQGTLIMDEMSRRIQFANGLVEDHPTDCPPTPSLKVTQPGVAEYYCFYESSGQLLERLPDGTDFNLLDGTPQPISISNVAFAATGGNRVTISFQLNDDRGNTMAFATDLVTRN